MEHGIFGTIARKLVRDVAWAAKRKTIFQVLSPRCRRDRMPENGRFSAAEIRRIAAEARRYVEALMPYFKAQGSLGNYQNEYVGLIDLAIYRALREEGVEREYAVALIGDMQWQAVVNAGGLVPIIDPLRHRLQRLTSKDPLDYLDKRLHAAKKYPYSEPGYRMDLHRDGDVFHMNIHSCPVFEFYKQFGPEELALFRRTWCTFDFSAAERLVEGGRYQREHTLSDGDPVCDMRWSIAEPSARTTPVKRRRRPLTELMMRQSFA